MFIMCHKNIVSQIRLVSLYQRTGRILEGFNLCSELEARHQWPSSREWYSCLVEMAENYQVADR